MGINHGHRNKSEKGIQNNEQIKQSIYNCIMHHPQVVQSPIANYCMKVKIDGHTEPQLIPKILLQMSVRELHNTLFSTIIYGGLKEARYEDDNTIISVSTLRSLFTPQLKISSRCKVICGCECYISDKIMHS